ncbi:ribulose bisphosphate carboxylase/oxygenase activase 2 [Hibiscus syriacus]|uniref:Ribulose bisphosphate carboxylase/oxygenase activase 2 n=1 Tax=Hibiscus syriacus TaxID=106335 RepID=A0A6A2ZHJ9_HIBSY|nr:ribulose bisphosphate carboxylase/oxygenase activase 2 [Hibiscus syriacus]
MIAQSPSPWPNQRTPLSVDVNVAYAKGREEVGGTSHQPMTQDFFMMSSGKRKRDDFVTQYQNGGYIPQQDGAGDSTSEVANAELLAVITAAGLMQLRALQPINLTSLDELLTDGRTSAFLVSWPDLQAATPAPIPQNDIGDDDNDKPLNEDDLDDVDQGEELNTQHLVLSQFDKVTRTKSRWKCTLKDGIMHINNKDINSSIRQQANLTFDYVR